MEDHGINNIFCHGLHQHNLISAHSSEVQQGSCPHGPISLHNSEAEHESHQHSSQAESGVALAEFNQRT